MNYVKSNERGQVMKRTGLFVLTFLITIFFLSSCVIMREKLDFHVRMTAEQIRQGTFTGGRLIVSNHEIDQLKPGMLIPIIDKRQGFVKAEDSEGYLFTTLEVYYGYYYVVDATVQTLTLDYLLYDEEGRIVNHRENMVIHADADSASQRKESHGLVYQTLASRTTSYSQALEGCSFLSFPWDIPDEHEQQYFDHDKVYRTVLFRLQKSGTKPYNYQSGILAAHPTEDYIILGSRFFDNVVSEASRIKISDPDLPLWVGSGDYILDTHGSSARRITNASISDDDPGYTIFDTEDIHVQKVVGAFEMKLEGDLAEIIERYGTQEDRRLLETLIKNRSSFDFWNDQGSASLWKGSSQVELEMEYDYRIGATIDFTATINWSETSFSGQLSIDSDADYELLFKLLGVDPGTKMTGKFITIPIKIPIEKLTFGVTISLVADFESDEENASIDYGMKVKNGGGSFGIQLDTGVRLEFLWGFIPYPRVWNDSTPTAPLDPSVSVEFIETRFQELEDHTLKIGLQLNLELNLLGAIIYNQDFDLGIATDFIYDPIHPDYQYWADNSLYSKSDNVKIGIGVPFTSIGYTWNLGTVWDDQFHIVSIPLLVD